MLLGRYVPLSSAAATTSGLMLEPGSMIQGVYDAGVSEALASMGKVMEDLHWLTADIREIAKVLRGEEIAETLKNLAEASEDDGAEAGR